MTDQPEQNKQQEERIEQLEALRNNEGRVVRSLAACRRLAINIGGAAGNYATFGQNEEVLLRSFADILAAHASVDGRYDQLFTQRYRKAGLTARDINTLSQRLKQIEETEKR